MQKIRSAKDIPLNESMCGGLPDMSDAIPGWFQPLSFGIISKAVNDFEAEETIRRVHTMGMVQPMSAQQLMMKPEGQRSWKWLVLHCLADIELKPDDAVICGGEKYRVMARLDWRQYGYCECHICRDYEGQAWKGY